MGGVVSQRQYFREELPEGCEVFALETESAAAAQELAEALTGAGGLGGIHHTTLDGSILIVQYIGDLFLLFDFIASTGVATKRRALLPLDDANLMRVASVLWRDEQLSPERILERAALLAAS